MADNPEIKDLRPYFKNPRKIDAEKFQLLQDSLKKFGDLSGIVWNARTGELVSGHQRIQALKKGDPKVHITQRYETRQSDGTLAEGYVLVGDQKYSFREVEFTDEEAERANIAANKISGFWDYDTLANQFSEGVLLESGFTNAELGFTTVLGAPASEEKDTDQLSTSMESYLGGNIKHIALYFKKEEFDAILTRLDAVMAKTNTDSHTNAFLALLEFYESN